MTAFIERSADRRDLAVHHPRRRDHVGPCIRLRDGDARVALDRHVVVDVTGLGEDAAVAVIRVLVEAVVGHEDEPVTDFVAQVAQRDLHDTVDRVGL